MLFVVVRKASSLLCGIAGARKAARLRFVSALIGGLVLGLWAPVASATPRDDVAALAPFWRQNAPLCAGYPSSAGCEDGDMTLFSGLLCAAGDPLGCKGVKDAQDQSGRWHRSPRLAADPSLRKDNSFSWDMALGVQLYVATTGDKAALERWLAWVETHRPCLVQSPKYDGQAYCLVRGWPRWCTDDTEKGCTAKPQNLATLVRTIDRLGVAIPPPAEDPLPGGVVGAVLKELQAQSRDANAALSLQKLLAASRDLQPKVLLIDAAVNREGYPRHLVGAEVMLSRKLGFESSEADLAAWILAAKEPKNPFFAYLVQGPSEGVAARVMAVAPRDAATLPTSKADWAWQRTDADEAWRRSNLWDFTFMSRLLARP